MLDSSFRMYGELYSSCFDFFPNKLEPAQTKSLGYLLAKSEVANKIFLNVLQSKVRANFKNGIESEKLPVSKLQNGRLVVDCELNKKANLRLDILLRYYDCNNKPILACLLEAKSIAKKRDATTVEDQLTQYLQLYKDELSAFESVKGCILTSYSIMSLENKDIIYLTWEDIIGQLYVVREKDSLIRDFCDFILNCNNMNRFYDKEVLSIAAGSSIENVEKLRIYLCQPNRFKSNPLFVTFRAAKGGEMKRLYRIKENVLSFDCQDKESLRILEEKYPGITAKIKQWITVNNEDDRVHDERQLFIMDEGNLDIELPVPVKPERNNVDKSGWEYSLSDFFRKSEQDEVVIIKKNHSDNK